MKEIATFWRIETTTGDEWECKVLQIFKWIKYVRASLLLLPVKWYGLNVGFPNRSATISRVNGNFNVHTQIENNHT